MPEYTFPFDTCERPRPSGIAQPWSALINLVNCLVILYFLLRTKTTPAFLFLLSLLLFEAVHTFSHMVHLPGKIQISIVHTLAYCANATFLWYAYQQSLRLPSWWFGILYLALVCLDIYAFMHLGTLIYLCTQAAMLLSVFAYYYRYFPKALRESMPWILVFILVTIALIANESYHCTRMLAANPHFPYHILIEFTGLVLFYLISRGISQ